MARVPYRGPETLAEEHRELVVSSLQPGKTVNVYRAVANNPPVLEGLRSFLGALWADAGLTDRERELVILSVARAVDSEYEWHQHVAIARSVGIDDETIRAIGEGDADLGPAESALLAYALAVLDGTVDDADHASVAAHYDEEVIVGVAATAAAYGGLARLIDALGVEVEGEFVGWAPSE